MAKLTLKEALVIAEFFGPDGHGVYKESVVDRLVELGVSRDKLDRFVCDLETDGSYKGSMWDGNGNRINKLRGIYSLDILYGAATAVGAKSENYNGRGFRAQHYCAEIYRIAEEAGLI